MPHRVQRAKDLDRWLLLDLDRWLVDENIFFKLAQVIDRYPFISHMQNQTLTTNIDGAKIVESLQLKF